MTVTAAPRPNALLPPKSRSSVDSSDVSPADIVICTATKDDPALDKFRGDPTYVIYEEENGAFFCAILKSVRIASSKLSSHG